MKKTIYTPEGHIVTAKHVTRLDGKIELNPSALTPKQLHATCGLFTYEPQTTMTKNGKPAKYGKLVINKANGTCTHELIELSEAEIAQKQEDQLRSEFEAEQQAAKDEAFEAWKKSKTIKISIIYEKQRSID